MNDTTRELDHFESSLLGELRSHVATRTAGRHPSPRPARRWAAVGLVAAAATGATVLVTGLGGGVGIAPAYAVDTASDGEVVVRIARLEDAAGLQADLRDAGIDARVIYSDGRVLTTGFAAEDLERVYPSARCDDPRVQATFTRDGDDLVLRIPVVSPLRDRPVHLSAVAGDELVVSYPSGDRPGNICGVTARPE